MALSLCTRLQSMCKIGIYKHKLNPITSRACVRLFSLNRKGGQFLSPFRSNVVFRRTFIFKLFVKPTPEKLKLADGIPDHYKLIYRNAMHRYLLSAQIFSTLSAIIVCCIALVSYYTTNGYVTVTTYEWRIDQPKPIENESLIYVASFITLCVMLQVMISKMPIRIYNLPQKEKYVFVFYGSLPATKRRLICKVNDVAKLDESGLLPWKDSRYEIRNKQSVIMLENFFRRPADLNIMLGYQKPPEGYD